MDQGLGIAHGFAGYNAALLGRADETLAGNRAGHAPRSRRIGGTASGSFLADLPSCCSAAPKHAIELLQKSLERNPSYGSAQLFLMAALSLIGRRSRSGRDGRVVPQAISGLPNDDIRAALAVAFGFLNLSRPNSSTFREDPRSRRGELRLGS